MGRKVAVVVTAPAKSPEEMTTAELLARIRELLDVLDQQMDELQ